ncbi:MAG: tetratricopeptide repeat protein [Azospirillum sp.]|nr:tetratricopeptide repeat protein [Azospirillum sp.]
MHDVFLSYARSDAAAVDAVVAALERERVSVWIDRSGIEPAAPITEGIAEALAHAKVLLAWYSAAYPKSRYCQWELTAAWAAGEAEGAETRRVLVVNPEAKPGHIQPTVLRDHATLSTDPAEIARTVKRQLGRLTKPLGEIAIERTPRWYGANPVTPAQFVGRLPELWKLHSFLNAGTVTAISAAARAAGPKLGQVQGLGGIGKSLLAQEYALRFGACYPGGVVWLRASEGGAGQLPPPERHEALRTSQMRDLAVGLGIATEASTEAEIGARVADAFAQAKKPFLWVLDDWPQQGDGETLRRWLAPVPGLGRTLITSRGRRTGNLGACLRLSTLEPEDAFALLTRNAPPTTTAERDAARTIVERLGCHALAVDVAGAAVGLLGYARFLERLGQPIRALELAAELAADLPLGHELSIVRTLMHSIGLLPLHRLDVLLLAAELASAPIPLELVAKVLEQVDDGPAHEAEASAARGFRAAEKLSLAEEAGPGSFTLHVLTAAVLRHHPDHAERREKLHRAAVAAIDDFLEPAVDDNREHPRLAAWLPHARALTAETRDEETLRLLEKVWRYDYRRGTFLAAEDSARRILESCRNLFGADHHHTLASKQNLATTLCCSGDLSEVSLLQEEVLERRIRVSGVRDPETITAMCNLAATLRNQGNFRIALELNTLALDISLQVRGADHRDTLMLMSHLATTLHAQGDLAAARALLERALKKLRQHSGEDHPDTLQLQHNLAGVLGQLGDQSAARVLLEAALAGRRRVLTDEHSYTVLTFWGSSTPQVDGKRSGRGAAIR